MSSYGSLCMVCIYSFRKTGEHSLRTIDLYAFLAYEKLRYSTLWCNYEVHHLFMTADANKLPGTLVASIYFRYAWFVTHDPCYYIIVNSCRKQLGILTDYRCVCCVSGRELAEVRRAVIATLERIFYVDHLRDFFLTGKSALAQSGVQYWK
jgi:hypothetical protein